MVLGLSVLANIALFLMLLGFVALFATGQPGILTEEVIQPGPRATKIAVIGLHGIIDDRQSESVYRQFKRAREDKRVKAVILRVNSPGGTISAKFHKRKTGSIH